MSSIIYSSPPPTPAGLTTSQMNILRESLQEDTLQTLFAYIRQAPQGQIYDLKRDGGLAGDGRTDDTVALQAFLDTIQGKNATVYVPGGTYLISSLVTGRAGTGVSWKWYGEQGLSSQYGGGTVFKWVGASGGKMFKFRGLNTSIISDICFDGNNLAATCMHGCEVSSGGALVTPSSGVYWFNCQFANCKKGTGSNPFLVGLDDGVTPGMQASEYRWYRCSFSCSEEGGNAGVYIQTTSNCKNFIADTCTFINLDYGWYQPNGSGVTTLDGCSFGNIGYNVSGYAAFMGAGNALNMRGVQFENAGVGYAAGIMKTGNGVCGTLEGGYYNGNAPATDYSVVVNGPTAINRFYFERNTRAGANVHKLQIEDPGGWGSITISNCAFVYESIALKSVPIYDGSNNHLFDEGYGKTVRLNVTAFNNKSGLHTTTIGTNLPNFSNQPFVSLFGAIDTDDNSTGVTFINEGDRYTVTIPYTAVQVAALTKTLTIGVARQYRNIQACVQTVTANFTGIAGPVTDEVGISTDLDAFLLSNTVSAGTATKGLVSADLGAELATATRAHPDGFMVTPAAAAATLQVKFTSASGNLSGLSAGSLTITFTLKYVGP